MKYIGKTLFCLIAACMLVIACSDDDNGTDPNDNNNNNNNNNNGSYSNTVTATMNGQSWSSINVLSTYQNNILRPLQITATGPNETDITLFVADAKGTGTFTIDEQLVNVGADFDDINISRDRSGTITINELTNAGAKGTFSFQGVDAADNKTLVVTNGEFDVAF